jgi:glycosyltransferase involved in cell wall biosynthesis
VKFSIIVPSFNQGRFLRRTLDSILSQSAVDKEVLVFDAGSTDESLDILRSYGPEIRWVSEPDKGQTDAINKGLKVATGDVHCYLNSDDIFYPDALAKVRDYFESDGAARLVYGDGVHIDEEDRVTEAYYNEPHDYRRLLEICYICQPAAFWRREVTREYGLFDATLHYAMDYEYWLRVASVEPLHYLKGEVLAGSRMYADNKTLSKRVEVHREILAVTRRYTVTPYRWLRVLADLLAREPGMWRPDASYGRNILLLAEEHGIPLDGVVLAEASASMASDPVRLLAAVLPSKLRGRARRITAEFSGLCVSLKQRLFST